MIENICVSNETLVELIAAGCDIEVDGLSMFDYWTSIKCTLEIINVINDKGLIWRYDYFSMW